MRGPTGKGKGGGRARKGFSFQSRALGCYQLPFLFSFKAEASAAAAVAAATALWTVFVYNVVFLRQLATYQYVFVFFFSLFRTGAHFASKYAK